MPFLEKKIQKSRLDSRDFAEKSMKSSLTRFLQIQLYKSQIYSIIPFFCFRFKRLGLSESLTDGKKINIHLRRMT